MNNINISKSFNFLSIILLFSLPLGYIFSPALINISIIVIVFNFIFICLKNEINFNYKDRLFLSLIFFWIYILIQSFFLENASFEKSFGFLRFILLPYAIYYLLEKNSKYINKIKVFYLGITFFVIIDVLIQYHFGKDLLGFHVEISNGLDRTYSNWKELNLQRFSGPFGTELRAGSFILFFGMIALFFNFKMKNNKHFIITFFGLLIFLIGIIITGDRAPIINLLIALTLYLFFEKKHRKKAFLLFSSSLIVFILFLNFSSSTNFRYIENFKVLKINSLNNKENERNNFSFLKDNPWGAHYLAAYEIFKSSPLVGKGVKSFRFECDKYPNIDSTYVKKRCSTHAHNIFFELLSETGIIGIVILLSALIFLIKTHLKSDFDKSNMMFYVLIALILPIKPTGALFSTWYGSMIWLLMGFIFYNNKYFKN